MIKIAVIGANYLQLPLVNKINELGYESHCFAWDNDDSVCKEKATKFYPISIVDKEAILENCQEIQINAILSIASDVAVPTISYVAEQMGLIANSLESALISTNKFLMRTCFQNAGLLTPFYSSLTSSTELDGLKDFSYPLIVKPTDRSGSRGVTIAQNKDELVCNIQRAIQESFEKKAIFEGYIEGKEYSVESISQDGQHTILAVTEKVTSGAPYFVELEHHQPANLDSNTIVSIEETVKKGLDALLIENGASHSELKVNSEGVFLIEIGGRMGGDFIGSHLVQFSTGYDYLKNTIQVALGNKIDVFEGKEQHFSGVYFLSKLTTYLLPFFENPPQNSVNYLEVNLQTSDLEELRDSSNRAGYIIYKGKSKLNLK